MGRPRVLPGAPASPGVAVGYLRRLEPPAADVREAIPPSGREGELGRARQALLGAAAELGAIAARLRAEGRREEADIVETGVLMASDPAFEHGLQEAIVTRGLPAAPALADVAEQEAGKLAALDDPHLAARADDVRSLGRRAGRLADGGGLPAPRPGGDGMILVASELGPADVIEIEDGVEGVALAHGGVTAHAAIVARSLGVPLVTDVGEALLAEPDGTLLVIDGTEGSVVADPAPDLVERARVAGRRKARARERAAGLGDLPAETTDGRRVAVLVNAATPAEVATGLRAGAEGCGLLRTELAFLDAPAWPTQADHLRTLEPVLAGLEGRTATVRVLDFGGDKTPPFLAASAERGIALLLENRGALTDQLAAVLEAGRHTRLRILLPLVRDATDVRAVREMLHEAATDAAPPELGAMIEDPDAVARAGEIAEAADFLSIGTNDLTHAWAGTDRFASNTATTHHPAVLALIARVTDAGARAGIPVEVCGEAASDPLVTPLLLGLGVDELSVGAARVGEVRAWIRALEFEGAKRAAARAMSAAGPTYVERLGRGLARRLELLGEAPDAGGEGLDGGIGVGSAGAQLEAGAP